MAKTPKPNVAQRFTDSRLDSRESPLTVPAGFDPSLRTCGEPGHNVFELTGFAGDRTCVRLGKASADRHRSKHLRVATDEKVPTAYGVGSNLDASGTLHSAPERARSSRKLRPAADRVGSNRADADSRT